MPACAKCGRTYDPPFVSLREDDPVRKHMDQTGQCWWCCRGLVLRSGTPPAAQPRPGHPVATVPRGHDDSTAAGTGRGGGTL